MQREEMKLEVIVEVKVIIDLLVVVAVVRIEVVQEGSCVVCRVVWSKQLFKTTMII